MEINEVLDILERQKLMSIGTYGRAYPDNSMEAIQIH